MRKNNGFGDTRAKRHEIEDIDIYEVMDSELDILQSASSSDLFLDFGIGLASIFGSFLCALLTLHIEDISNTKFVIFLLICIVSGVATLVLFSLWLFSRKSKAETIAKIKSRKVSS